MSQLSHINDEGKANMVDVGHKPQQVRTAKASGFIALQHETIRLINESLIKKGDVITIAEIAGIQAAKETSRLIPLCHPLQLTKVEVKAEVQENGVLVKSLTKCIGQTGVEMEALTAVNVTLLTIYDMCKAVDKNMVMGDVKLDFKEKI
ncbi:cyclic pyranopterin monophosphate synthase MoaC [Draconibacterium sp. IB214405]|uniref:cyclic pyranopterin monophosphate synthase MoaC n=1 Tax=Draconibacterium sp. IB214405 TaxID=3097352 RepID=UPI002A0E9369|nr:cyclic pyranopterin monophosphate synthase MoaC [Draconibacterium sp. IB214405]MDX8340204.1 cyclic pyranopterin monophosphate synthase MoaC [Draconibacterium sp. IB214405]